MNRVSKPLCFYYAASARERKEVSFPEEKFSGKVGYDDGGGGMSKITLRQASLLLSEGKFRATQNTFLFLFCFAPPYSVVPLLFC